ncbi:ScyD/ScyE family protein [Calothrix sp. CCY 0018]|uniref:ScyD/ScyE family protein n=1 Tax=Calothrix sp. CCY 0018 TaxID=3103864 RepID=UPI0039C67C11
MTAQLLTNTSFEIIADNLDNPKGLTFAPDGSLYITEAGTGGNGPSIPAPSGQGNLHYGRSGAISKIENGTVRRILTGLPSVAFPDGSGAAGPHDIKFDADGKAYVLLGYAANPAFRESLGDNNLGTIITLDLSNNTWSSIADITNCEVIKKIVLKDSEVASNPLSLYVDGNRLVIVDAGANSLFSINTDGSNLELIAAIPERILTNPILPGAKSENFDRGHVPAPGAYHQAPPSQMSIQSVPTDVVKGADGAYYVCEFSGFPFPEGEARIYKTSVNGELEVFASGFTQLIDMTFDAEGNLYVLQHMNQSGWKGKPDGALIKIAPNSERTMLMEGNGLEMPSALTIGPDGAFYIINRGGRPGIGQIIRVENHKNISHSYI